MKYENIIMDALNLFPKGLPDKHSGDGHQQACLGGNQSLFDARCHGLGIAHAIQTNHPKGFHHAGHGAQQSQKRSGCRQNHDKGKVAIQVSNLSSNRHFKIQLVCFYGPAIGLFEIPVHKKTQCPFLGAAARQWGMLGRLKA